MSVAVLLFRLEEAGVHVGLDQDGHSLTLSADHEPPADLLADIMDHKPELLAHLSQPDGEASAEVPQIAEPAYFEASVNRLQIEPPTNVLPEPLARLVRAAASGQLNHTATLESPWPGLGGLVMNLGDYVLAWAASYAAGGDRAHVLARLEAARDAWGQA